MKTTNNKALLLATLPFFFPYSAAIADDNAESRPLFSLGLKAWDATWATSLPTLYTVVTPAGAVRVSESLDLSEASRKASVYPSFAVKSGKVMVSASHARFSADFHSPNTSVIAPNGMNVSTWRTDHIKRKESDLAAGYEVAPAIAVSLGYKHATEDRTTAIGLGGGPVPLYENKVQALLLGASANFAVSERLTLSNQIAYGPARIKLTFADNAVPDDKVNGRYVIYEVGLNYIVQTRAFSAVALGVGYRSQLARTHGPGPAGMNSRRYRDEREGFLLTMMIAI